MYIKVPKIKTYSTLALWIHVLTISDQRIKPNNETMLVYSLPLYNLEQNKSFNMTNSIGWMLLVLLLWGAENTSRGSTDGKNN